jgi:osmoprotectant transport system ATP-binding protein
MIALSDLSKTWPGSATASVTGVSLEVAAREFLVLVGPSGCGKTTTLNMLNRLIEPDRGSIRIDGADIRKIEPFALRRRIGYAFQEGGLFPHMTVAQNIAITPRLLGWTARDIAARVEELLALVQMPGFSGREVRHLSGGQRQRVALARALAARPRIMLLDEPFGALDPLIRDEIAEEYSRIHNVLGLTTVMVTHDMTEALMLADRIAVMRAGALVHVATPRTIVAHPADDFVARLMETPKRRAGRLAALLDAP